MATLLLSAAGAALGSGFGGTVLGLSGAVVGRAVGATLGRVIDQRLLGGGSAPVEVGRVDRFRLMSAGEGQPIAQVWGRMRLGGHVIWASEFAEHVARQGGGKGTPKATTEQYSYTVSLAVALCEGEILRLGRIWADGEEMDPDLMNLRLYKGAEDQLPDPKIEAVEGLGKAPAYRGTAYVVFEDLDLARFGNRVPQFSFEVVRAAKGGNGLDRVVEAVALIPGKGEYSLAATPVTQIHGPGQGRVQNRNTVRGASDFAVALEQLDEELPRVGAASLVVSWFGDDLRCGKCSLRPMVEQGEFEGSPFAWRAGGITRTEAPQVPLERGRPLYGGTPADGAVLEAIAALHGAGKAVMFYPFVLMTQTEGNSLPDPWTGAEGQPVLPWRGRISCAPAPGVEGSPDRGPEAERQVAAFFGGATPQDFTVLGGQVHYSGPPEDWGYRRFILHYAHLCALGGGVEAFCVGSELRGLTQIRGVGDSFPAVEALRDLAAEVRLILGANCAISYAADWSEYAGYQSPEGNRYFHLDPFWADPNVDFIGIDNYLPLSDWREGEAHLDHGHGSLYDLDYLAANVAGGEYYDWFYEGDEAARMQRRTPITDGAHDEPWIWRQKDLQGWWSNPHHERIDGLRSPIPTPWQPCAKPIWFTELGCAAIDKGSNQPNLFLDEKSSESHLPRASTGRRDDYIQMQYLRATAAYWGKAEHNPISPIYEGAMVDMSHGFVWAWDARPFPQFPGQVELWADGGNYARGHWLSGRAANQPLADVVKEICAEAGLWAVDTSQLHGVVRGYMIAEQTTARAALQALMLAHGVDAVDRGDVLRFQMRGRGGVRALSHEDLALHGELGGDLLRTRSASAEIVGRVRLIYTEAEGDFVQRQEEACFPDEEAQLVSSSELSMLLTPAEARGMTERWLAEARLAREGLRFALPPSLSGMKVGDLVEIEGEVGGAGRYRIDRSEREGVILHEAVRVDPSIYAPSDAVEVRVVPKAYQAAGTILPLFLDLPLLREGQEPQAPYVAISAKPWPGPVGVWSSAEEAGFSLNRMVAEPAAIGVTETPLAWAQSGLWDRGAALRVKMIRGRLSSASAGQVFNGANALAIGDGASGIWEVLQFSDANLVSEDCYELTGRLRGLAGTDAFMPAVWPAGSMVVVLDEALVALDHPTSRLGMARQYRIGALERGFDDPMVIAQSHVFHGVGLRPLCPVHLRRRLTPDGMQFTWCRRGRVGADSWYGEEIPLGEAREAYRVRLRRGEVVLRQHEVTGPSWRYEAAQMAGDGPLEDVVFEVAQLSENYGAGAWAAVALGG